MFVFFFFSSRRRHTRLQGDWSSDVCSSDLSEPQYLAARIQEPCHRSPEMVPLGHTSLMLEIPCDVGDPIWSAADDVIYERCLDDLRKLGLPPLRDRTLGYFSSYVREGYPIYHLGYQA